MSLIGLMSLIAVFALGAKTASAAGLIKPPNNLGLVGYWSFDDNGGVKATDFSGKGNTGTLTNMEVADWVDGKRGKALDLDGSDEYVTIPDASSLDFTTTMTLAGWFKFDSLSGYNSIFDRDIPAPDYKSYYITSETTSLSVRINNAYGVVASAFTTTGTWYHVAIVYDGTQTGNANRLKMYINGSAATVSFSGDAIPATLNTSSNPMILGSYSGAALFYNGIMDEVRAYNRALSATEASALYEQSNKISNLGAPNNYGLIGYWNFDENLGTFAADSSGKGNHGTLVNMEATDWIAGKRGSALSFDGTDERVTVPNSSSFTDMQGLTLSFWYYPDPADTQDVIAKYNNGSSFLIYSAHSGTGFWNFINGGYIDTGAGIFSANQWSYLTVTYDQSNIRTYVNGVLADTKARAVGAVANSTGNLEIMGYPGDQFVNGKMDELRIYNRALSADEISVLYRQSTKATKVNTSINTIALSNLVGWWTFDGGDMTNSNASTTDRSGQGNHGSLIGSSGSQNKPQPVTGKIGQAIRFDGTDDYISVPHSSSLNLSGPLTIAAWVKPTVAGASYPAIVTKGALNTTYSIFLNGGAAHIRTTADGSTFGTTNLPAGVWSHVVGTWDGSSLDKIYVNGAQENSTGGNTTLSTSTDPVGIGGHSGGNYFNGSLDDVRIYNKAFSADEVLTLYNQGK